VDGVLATEPIPMESEGGNGNWKLSSESPALVISSGLVFQGSKKPLGLTLDRVKELIEANSRAAYYETLVNRRVTLSQALEGKFEDLGKEVLMHTSLDLNLERDRYFKVLPKTGNQLLTKHYDSEPLKVKQ